MNPNRYCFEFGRERLKSYRIKYGPSCRSTACRQPVDGVAESIAWPRAKFKDWDLAIIAIVMIITSTAISIIEINGRKNHDEN